MRSKCSPRRLLRDHKALALGQTIGHFPKGDLAPARPVGTCTQRTSGPAENTTLAVPVRGPGKAAEPFHLGVQGLGTQVRRFSPSCGLPASVTPLVPPRLLGLPRSGGGWSRLGKGCSPADRGHIPYGRTRKGLSEVKAQSPRTTPSNNRLFGAEKP